MTSFRRGLFIGPPHFNSNSKCWLCSFAVNFGLGDCSSPSPRPSDCLCSPTVAVHTITCACTAAADLVQLQHSSSSFACSRCRMHRKITAPPRPVWPKITDDRQQQDAWAAMSSSQRASWPWPPRSSLLSVQAPRADGQAGTSHRGDRFPEPWHNGPTSGPCWNVWAYLAGSRDCVLS